MISQAIRLFFIAVIVIGFGLIGVTTFAAEGGYADNRLRADMHPKTIEARRNFHARISKLFKTSTAQYNLPDMQLELDQRLVAQYGRGQKSANEILPKELEQILKFISQAKYRRSELVRQLKALKSLEPSTSQDIEEAVSKVANIKKIKLSYWGYLSRTEMLPEYNKKSHKLEYFAKWHEGSSTYELYSEAQMKSHIVRSIINELNGEGWSPFKAASHQSQVLIYTAK